MAYDIHVGPLPVSAQRLPHGIFGFVYNKSIALKGFQRTINTWARVLLTEEGSDSRERRLGTPFARLIGSNVGSTEDIEEVCRISVQRATEQVQSYQALAPPELEEEKIGDVAIVDLVFDPDGLGFDLYVLISNTLGQRVPVVLPIKTTR